ncbi:hypothetical protein D3C75_1216920 [compost metagenome]
MRHAPTLISTQHLHIRQALATRVGLQQDFSQHRRIEETEVHALPGQWMNGVRRVADQGQALGHVTLGLALTQGHAQTRVGAEHAA